MKRRLGLYAAVGVAVGVVLLAGSGGTVHAATCTLVPTLRDITVTQGLNTYNPLVRGKVALVRLYLSLPACAASGNAIAVKSALTGDATKTTSLTVTVKDATTGAVQSTNTIPILPTPAIAAPN